MSMQFLVIQIFNGVVVGMIYVLMAMGLSIVWGMMDIINFCHGLFYTLGAYLAYTVMSVTGDFFIGLVVAPLAVGILGALFEMTLLRRLYRVNIVYQVLMTFGIALMGRELIVMIYGPVGKSFVAPEILSGVFSVGDIFFPKYRIFILAVAILLIAGTWLFIEKTRYGSFIRAGTENAEMVSALGVNIHRTFSLVFGLSMGIAAFSGVLSAPIRGVEFMMGENIMGICFAVVILGGLGSFWGAVLGGVIVGVAQSLVALVLPQASVIVIFLVMAVVLLVRPKGLLGVRD